MSENEETIPTGSEAPVTEETPSETPAEAAPVTEETPVATTPDEGTGPVPGDDVTP